MEGWEIPLPDYDKIPEPAPCFDEMKASYNKFLGVLAFGCAIAVLAGMVLIIVVALTGHTCR